MKSVPLSDHGKRHGTKQSDSRSEKPDMALSAIRHQANPKTDAIALELIRQLVKICPVYLANGNHEQKMRICTEEYGDRYEYSETVW